MSELRLGRPLSISSMDDDETDGLYLDSGTALNDVTATRQRGLPVPKPVALLPEPEARGIPFAFPSSLTDSKMPVMAKQEQKSDSISFAFPASLLNSETAEPVKKKDESGDFSRGMSAALGQTPVMLKGAVGYVGAVGEKTFGEGGFMSGLKRYGLEGFKKGMDEIQEKSKDTDDVTKAWERAKSGDLGALVDWAQYGIGYLAGNIAETAATALVGAGVGAAMSGPAAPAGAVAGAAGGAVAKTATKGLVRNLVEGMVEKEAARIAAKEGIDAGGEVAIKRATRNVAMDIGASTALAGSAIIKETGSIYGEAVEEAKGRELDGGDLARIFGAGVVAGLTEMVVDRTGIGAATGKIKIPGAGKAGRILVGGTIGGGLEGGTELLQTAIERFGAAKALTGEEAVNEYINAFALGALGGGTIGGVAGAFRSGKVSKNKLDEYLKDAQDSLSSDDGRQELFDSMMQDERMAAILGKNGITSGKDPNFAAVVVRAINTQKLLAEVEPPTAEQVAARTKQSRDDVIAAFGDTASTGTGVGTGANLPVVQRDSVVVDEENRELLPATEEGIQPVTLPAARPAESGIVDETIAMSGEDIVSRQQGFEVMPAFVVGKDDPSQTPNRFVSQEQAKTLLGRLTSGNKLENKLIAGKFATDEARDEARAKYNQLLATFNQPVVTKWDSLNRLFPDMENSTFQIRKGQRSKEAGGGSFFFVESRPGKPETKPTSPAATAVTTTQTTQGGTVAPQTTQAQQAAPQGSQPGTQPGAPATAAAPAQTNTVGPTLPPDLAGAKPRYGAGKTNTNLVFESDADKALFITAQSTPSARDLDYRLWLSKTFGLNAKQIDAIGQQVRSTIKAQITAGQAQNGVLSIKPIYQIPGAQPAATAAPAQAPAVQTDTAVQPATDPAVTQPAVTAAATTAPADASATAPATTAPATTAPKESSGGKTMRTAQTIRTEIESLTQKQDKLRQKNSNPPRTGTKGREEFDSIGASIVRLNAELADRVSADTQAAENEAVNKDRQSKDVDRKAAIEFWEDQDDGSVAHIPFKDLTPDRQIQWIKSHYQKKATAALHDEIVVEQSKEGVSLRTSEATEQTVRGIDPDVSSIKDLVDAVNQQLERAGDPAKFSASRMSVGDLVRKVPGLGLIEKTAKLFGKKVVFFKVDEGSPDFFDGAVIATKTTIFINVNTTRAHIRIFGHELVHAIRNSDPKTYQKLVNALAPMLDLQGYKAFANRQRKDGVSRDDKILEEAIGDIVGDRFGEPEFWQMLADENPSTFVAVAKAVIDFIDSFLAKLTGQNTLGSEKLIKDLRQAREQIASVLSEVAPKEAARSENTGYTGTVKVSERRKAEAYFKETGVYPYVSEGQIEIPLDAAEDPSYSIKAPYTEAQQKSSEGSGKSLRNHPILGLPLNQNGTVTLYFPTTNDDARRVVREKLLKGKEGANRFHLTNESSAAAILANRGNIEQDVGGANILVQVDPDLLQVDQEFENGRRDFFIPIAEGNAFREKMKQTKLFTMNKSRKDGISDFATIGSITDGVTKGVEAYKSANSADRRKLVAKARALLKREHNVGTLLGENGKLEKTRVGEYGLTYEGKSVASMGLGLASAQKINTKNLTTCPLSAACERLCLGETSGQNLLYGGEGSFRSGPRLSQYLKTEALVMNPEAFAIVLADEVAKFRAWTNAETENKTIDGKRTKVEKQQYASAIRLNVTSDFPPKVFRALIDANPDTVFYDYTKLFSNQPIAKNHHLTYSSTGFSQKVGGKVINNPNSNWPEMMVNLLRGKNVAMAFSSRTAMPSFVVDEETGRRFKVWNGDNYDARFLDPAQPDGIGMIIGLTNKDRTGDPAKAAADNDGFFIDYDPSRDGDTVTVPAIAGNFKPKKLIQISASPSFSLKRTDTDEFGQWFRKSQITDGSGSPATWYHGTAREISAFRAKQAGAIFVAPKPSFAADFSLSSEQWMAGNYRDFLSPKQIEAAKKDAKKALASDYKGRQLSSLRAEIDRDVETGAARDAMQEAAKSYLPSGPNIIPVYVRSEKPFDFDNPDHIDEISKTKTGADLYPEELAQIKNGRWSLIEKPHVQRAIKEAGFDGFYVIEGGVKNLAVYDPNQLKSIFNGGSWSDATDNISFSRNKTKLGFYSALSEEVGKLKLNAAQPTGWKDQIKGLINKGLVKQDEIEWSGLNDWLSLQQGKVTKDQVTEYLNDGGVRVEEAVLGERDPWRQRLDMLETRGFRNLSEDERVELERLRDRRDQEGPSSRAESSETKYDQYTLPGGENYREVLLTLPTKKAVLTNWRVQYVKGEDYDSWTVKADMPDGTIFKSSYDPEEMSEAEALAAAKQLARKHEVTDDKSSQTYQSSHWDQPNVLAHIRVNDRTDADGKKVLFVEEIQSDWGQEGKKKGFALTESQRKALEPGSPEAIAALGRGALGDMRVDVQEQGFAPMQQTLRGPAFEGLPVAPFVTKTEGWLNLALKRVLTMAAEGGYDKVAFTTGDQNADRYDLSRQVGKIEYSKNNNGYDIDIYSTEGVIIKHDEEVPVSQLEDLLGKEITQKIVNGEGYSKNPLGGELPYKILSGLDLKIGGEGMKTFYDQIIPNALKKLLPKVGDGQIGQVNLLKDSMRNYDSQIMKDDLERLGENGFRAKYAHNEQPGFDITSAMREKVDAGLPMFSKKRYESQFEDLPPDVRAMAIAKGFVSPPAIRERLESLRPRMAERIVQGAFDKFRSVKDISMKAYIMLRLSTGGMDGAVSTLLHYGQVFNDDGALNLKKGTKGLLEVLNPVGPETDRFLMWIAANRADQLSKEDRERFFSQDQIKALKRINLGTMKDGKSRPAVYAEALRQMNELNRSVLDVARQTGLIDDAAYKKFSSDIWYVPFYRAMEEDNSLSGAQTSTGAVGQYLSKTLKGSERPLNDLMENVILNWSHILSASMRNAGAVETMAAAQQMSGIVTKITPVDSQYGKTPAGDIVPLKGTVKVMEGGKEVRYQIDDELVLSALTSVTAIHSDGFFVRMGREFKTMLTRAVSLSPTFKLNNLIRESIQSIGVSQLSYNPLANMVQGLSAYKNDRAEALAGGGLFAMGNAFDGDQASAIKRLLKAGVSSDDILTTPEKAAAWFKKAWDKYDTVSDAMENANRLALYKQLRESGVSHMEAAYAARDLQDYSLQGSWAAIRYAAMLLPYFNARLQGMYKLGREGVVPVIQFAKGDESQRQKAAKFATVLGAVTFISLALYLGQKDDEDWKKREDWDRDGFFWFKIPGTKLAARIPKPFEMGAFASVIERLTEQMVDSGVEGKVFGRRLMAILADNLAINPIPQIIRPLEDLRRNKDGFTDRPIEPESMRRLSPENRVASNTSPLAVAAGTVNSLFAEAMSSVTGVRSDSMKVSPIQYDYLIRGYLGWLGTAIITTSELAVSPFKKGETPDRKLDQMFVVGSYLRELPASQSRYVTDFYANAKEIATTVADYKALTAAGKYDEARALYESKQGDISIGKLYAKRVDQLSDINKRIKKIAADEQMSGAEKREQINYLEEIRNGLARRTEEARIERARGTR